MEEGYFRVVVLISRGELMMKAEGRERLVFPPSGPQNINAPLRLSFIFPLLLCVYKIHKIFFYIVMPFKDESDSFSPFF